MKINSIALRNLSRQKRRSILLATAIAFGVMIVTAVNAFSTGTIRIIKENVADLIGGHAFIFLEQRVDEKTIRLIEDETKLLAVVKGLGINDDQITRTVQLQNGELRFGSKETNSNVIGVNWTQEKLIIDKLGVPGDVYEQLKKSPNAIVISQKSANVLKAKVGDSILIKGRTVYGQQNVAEMTIAYINSDTSDISGMMSFASRAELNVLLNLPDENSYNTMRIRLRSLDETTPFVARLKPALAAVYPLAPDEGQGFSLDSNVFKMGSDDSAEFEGQRAKVTDINSLLDFFNQISGGLALASVVMLVFLLLITMIGIYNTFRMILYERTQEIGTMRALGMQRKQVGQLFRREALFLALMGVFLGIILAAIVMGVFSLFNFGTQSAFSVLLSNGHLSFRIDPLNVIVSILLVSVFTVVAALGPARKAARLKPADALRTNY